MPVFYKTIDDHITPSDIVVVANGEVIEPLACEAEGCENWANHAFAVPDNRTGQHHPDYVLFCTEHAIEFSQK